MASRLLQSNSSAIKIVHTPAVDSSTSKQMDSYRTGPVKVGTPGKGLGIPQADNDTLKQKQLIMSQTTKAKQRPGSSRPVLDRNKNNLIEPAQKPEGPQRPSTASSRPPSPNALKKQACKYSTAYLDRSNKGDEQDKASTDCIATGHTSNRIVS